MKRGVEAESTSIARGYRRNAAMNMGPAKECSELSP
jgi:hypothetical protein